MPEQDHESLLIKCGTLIDGSGGEAAQNVGVYVDNGIIVETRSLDEALPSAGRVVEALDATLTPGFIDPHTHPAWSVDADPTEWDDSRRTPEGLFAWSLSAVQSALAAGVTTIRDCGSPTFVIVELRRAIERGTVPGPRVLTAGPCLTTTAGHADFIGMPADDEAELRKGVRALCHGGADLVKVMASGGAMDPHTNRRMPQYTEAQLVALVEDAHRLSMPVAAHATSTESIRRAVRAGVDTLAHCNWLGETMGSIDYDPKVADEILWRDTIIELDLPNSFADYSGRDGEAFIAEAGPSAPRNRWQTNADLRKRGARITFCSDEFGRRMGTFPTLLFDAISTGEVSVVEAVHRVTGVAAQAVVPALQLGLVRPGYLADLALFDGDLVADPGGLTHCRSTWRSGVPRS